MGAPPRHSPRDTKNTSTRRRGGASARQAVSKSPQSGNLSGNSPSHRTSTVRSISLCLHGPRCGLLDASVWLATIRPQTQYDLLPESRRNCPQIIRGGWNRAKPGGHVNRKRSSRGSKIGHKGVAFGSILLAKEQARVTEDESLVG